MKRKIIGVCLLLFVLAGFYFFLNTENSDNQRVKKIADVDHPEMTVDEIFRARIKKKHEKDLSDKLKFDNPEEEWPKVKRLWLDFANEMRFKNKLKKFQ